MINTIPHVNNNKPSNDFLLNFSFNNTKDKNIVNKIDNLLMELTAIGLDPK